MKETTIITGLIIVAATVLAGMGVITGDNWAIATSVAGGAKGLQGAADRFKPRGETDRGPS